jgi:hypothetical protein
VKKCPFKENGKLSKLFRLILWGLNLPMGSDTPKNKILRGIRPCGTKSCRVSDSTEQRQRCVYFIADDCSAGSDTPQNNALRGLILRLTKSCGVSDPAEQSSAYHTSGNNFKYEYYREFKTEFTNILGCEFEDLYGVDLWKKLEVENLVLMSLLGGQINVMKAKRRM